MGANVGMLQRRGGAGFPLEALQRRRITSQRVGQKLQRHPAAQPGVERFVHYPHPATAQLLLDAVV